MTTKDLSEQRALVERIDAELSGAPGSPDNRRAMLAEARRLLAFAPPVIPATVDRSEALALVHRAARELIEAYDDPEGPAWVKINALRAALTSNTGEADKVDYRDNLARALFEASNGMRLVCWSDETRDYWLARAEALTNSGAPVPVDASILRGTVWDEPRTETQRYWFERGRAAHPVELPGAEDVALREAEFVSKLMDALVIAYRRMGGIARIARSPNGAATIRNIAVLEAAAIHRTTLQRPRASDEVLADAGGADTLTARALLQEFVISLTGDGKNRRNTLSINHDRLAELVAEATATLSANPVTVDAGGAEGEAFRLMQAFYLSPYYDPKSARPADTVQAAIQFTLARVPGWQDISTAPKYGTRLNLCWGATEALDAHIELGKWSTSKGWVNTYGKPFHGDPEFYQLLPEPPMTGVILAHAAPAASDEAGVPAGMVLVPVEPTRSWASAMANIRQGRSSTPRCEPPGEVDIQWAHDRIADVLEAAKMLAAYTPKQATPTDEAAVRSPVWASSADPVGDLAIALAARAVAVEEENGEWTWRDIASAALAARPAPGSAGETSK